MPGPLRPKYLYYHLLTLKIARGESTERLQTSRTSRFRTFYRVRAFDHRRPLRPQQPRIQSFHRINQPDRFFFTEALRVRRLKTRPRRRIQLLFLTRRWCRLFSSRLIYASVVPVKSSAGPIDQSTWFCNMRRTTPPLQSPRRSGVIPRAPPISRLFNRGRHTHLHRVVLPLPREATRNQQQDGAVVVTKIVSGFTENQITAPTIMTPRAVGG